MTDYTDVFAWARALPPHKCNRAERYDLENPYWDIDDSGRFCRVCGFQVVTDRLT